MARSYSKDNRNLPSDSDSTTYNPIPGSFFDDGSGTYNSMNFNIADIVVPSFVDMALNNPEIVSILNPLPSSTDRSDPSIQNANAITDPNNRPTIDDVNRHDTEVEDSSSGIGFGTSSDTSRNDELGIDPASDLQTMVVNSTAYQSAHELFSSDAQYGRIFLIRLEAIPTSVIEADNTIWDQIGLSNNYEDVLRASYQRCLELIQNLVAEYQKFINSLPTTQVQQLNDAGINSAVTGQGVNGSSLSGIGANASTDPSQLASASSFPFIAAALDVCLNKVPMAAKAFADIRNSTRDSKVNEAVMLNNMWRDMESLGFDMSGFPFKSIDDVRSYMKDIAPLTHHAKRKYHEGIVDSLFAQFSSGAVSQANANMSDDLTTDFLSALGNFMIKDYVYERASRSALSEYQYNIYSELDSEKVVEATDSQNSFTKAQYDYEKTLLNERLKFINDWTSRILKSNDPVAKQALVQFLMGVDDTVFGKIESAVNTVLGAAASNLIPSISKSSSISNSTSYNTTEILR